MLTINTLKLCAKIYFLIIKINYLQNKKITFSSKK